LGYHVKRGQDITIRPEGKPRGLKLRRNFGEDYTIERIRERIVENTRPQRQPMPMPPKRARVIGKVKRTKKMTGLRVLYFVYLYKMGVLPKRKQANSKRVYFLYREDIRYMQKISDGARLLARHKIDTVEQLAVHKEHLQTQIQSLIAERKQIRTASKSTADTHAPNAGLVANINAQLKDLRRAVRLCEDIEKRSGIMVDKIREEQKSKKQREGEQIVSAHQKTQRGDSPYRLR